ncbi:sensor histidine kinase [Virgibacillus dakarensis]|uniref:sensor histidine kinase n=1 Tax=Virgibacillus dakarensis TaxID=1917889 RepID=UPI000B445B77|nr:HAMP domain-containing sensor histidine kinase [Virgibacillus dakarensis]
MSKLVLKLGGIIMISLLVVLLPLGYVANKIFTNFYYSEVQSEIGELSQKYAHTITSLDDQEMINMFKNLADLTNKEIYIVDNMGKVIADSGEHKTDLTKEDMNELSSGQSIQKRFHGSNKESTHLGLGYPIMNSGTFQGAFFVLASINDIQEPIEKIKDLLLLSAVGALFLALGITFVVAKKMSDPLLEMERATREIAKGNLDIRVDISSRDEVGSLAKAINDLALETNRYRTNRREFLANISHELRTPMSYLKGYAEVLKKGLYQTEEEKQDYLTIIEDETDRLVLLISDLFDLSKMEEGKIDLQLERLDLTEVLDTTLFKHKIELEKKGLSLQKQIGNHIPFIEADGMRLEQIFTNLLGNAIRYTNKGYIHVKVWSAKNNVYVSIEDTGVGISDEELALIFERFHRVEKSRSRELGGTGLGLAIVKNLVELQHGTISASSQVDKGTRFQLSFPIAE